MAEYAKSQGVPLSVLKEAARWIQREAFDSDAVKQDVTEENVSRSECSIATAFDGDSQIDVMCRSIIAFIEKTKGFLVAFLVQTVYTFCDFDGVQFVQSLPSPLG